MQHLTEIRPELFLQTADRKIASILRRINIIVGIGPGQPVIAALRHKAAAEIQARRPRHQRHRHIVKRNINLLPLACLLRITQSNHNRHACRHRRIHIRHQHARNRRSALGLAAHRRNSCQAHIADIMVSLLRQRSLFAIACQRAIDNARIDSLRCTVINPQLAQHTGAIAFHHHVRRLHQGQKGLASGLTLQVQHHALLVAVQLQMPIAKILEERRKAACIIAAPRLLNLDNLGTKIRQQHRATRSRQKPRQI